MLEAEKYREALKNAKRIVIKVGTSTITYANGKRNFSQIDRLAREISDLQNQGKEMILVTSGAVAVGVVETLNNKMRLFKVRVYLAAAGLMLLLAVVAQ